MSNMDDRIDIRLTKDQKKYLKDHNKSIAEIVRLGIQLYFDNEANCECKKKGIKVWNEFRARREDRN